MKTWLLLYLLLSAWFAYVQLWCPKRGLTTRNHNLLCQQCCSDVVHRGKNHSFRKSASNVGWHCNRRNPTPNEAFYHQHAPHWACRLRLKSIDVWPLWGHHGVLPPNPDWSLHQWGIASNRDLRGLLSSWYKRIANSETLLCWKLGFAGQICPGGIGSSTPVGTPCCRWWWSSRSGSLRKFDNWSKIDKRNFLERGYRPVQRHALSEGPIMQNLLQRVQLYRCKRFLCPLLAKMLYNVSQQTSWLAESPGFVGGGRGRHLCYDWSTNLRCLGYRHHHSQKPTLEELDLDKTDVISWKGLIRRKSIASS